MTKHRPLVIAGLLVALSAIGDAAAQSPSPSADLTEAGMNRRIAELRPEIEKIMGAKFAGPLRVRAVSRSFIAELVSAEGACLKAGFLSRMKPRLLRSTSRAEGLQYSYALMGKVDVATGTIHIVPANMRLLHRIGMDMVTTVDKSTSDGGAFERFAAVDAITSTPYEIPQSFLDIVLVHEAVHVRQMRKFQRVWGRIKGLSTIMTVRAVTEGHAEWVCHRWAKEKGLDDALDFYHKLISGEGAHGKGAAGVATRLTVFPYVKGHDFFEKAVAELGLEAAERRVMHGPPTRVADILDPAKYLAKTPDPEPTAGPPAEHPFTGRLKWKDGGPVASGAVAMWMGAPTYRIRTFKVENGTFGGTIPEGSKPRVELISADEHIIDDLSSELVQLDDRRATTLEVERPEMMTVIVHDAAGKPLPRATVWVTVEEDWVDFLDEDETVLLPAQDRLDGIPLVTDAEGKVTFPRPHKRAVDVLAIANGTGWGRAPIAEDDQLKPTVLKLRPGGDVEIEVTQWAKLEEPVIQLQPLERGPDHDIGLHDWHPVANRDGKASLRGLPTGIYVVTVRRKNEEGYVYGSETLNVTAGRPTQLAIPTRVQARIPTLAVKVAFPSAWGEIENPVDVVLHSWEGAPGRTRRKLKLEPAGPRMFSADATDVLPGRYLVSISDRLFFRWVDVKPGDDAVRVTLPAPRVVNLRLTDQETGKPLRGEYRFEGVEPEFSEGPWRRYARRARFERIPSDGITLRFAHPEIRLRVRAPLHAIDERTMMLVAGENNVGFEMVRAGRLKIEVKNARGKLHAKSTQFVLNWLGEQDLEISERKTTGRTTIRYLRPGRWRVMVLNGLDLADKVVEIKAGERAEVVFEAKK